MILCFSNAAGAEFLDLTGRRRLAYDIADLIITILAARELSHGILK